LETIPYVDLKTQYQVLKKSIHSRIERVLDHGQFINGPEVRELEEALAKFVGCKYALGCSSGTDALLIPMMALGIGPGDEVITTPFSFVATAETMHLVGATPVFVDINPETYNLDPIQVERAITAKTKAIVPVSLYGLPADLETFEALCQKYGLHLLEDAAQSFGARLGSRRSCNFGMAAGTSFFPAKPLGGYGDSGGIFTNDEKLFVAMREIREHGSEMRYHHTRLGVNARIDTLQAAILLAKLERYDWEMERRNSHAQRYNQAFAEVPNLKIPIVPKGYFSSWAQYTLRVPRRAEFQAELQKLGVPTSIHYPKIIPEQPWYQKFNPNREGKWPEARRAAQEVMSLPISPDLTVSQQDRVIEAVLSVAKKLS
jgi:UDP-2-acetamido-2-deoxy-ribo-hexuluronate aminotransferase